MTPIGFDTIIIDNRYTSSQSVAELIDIFLPLDIRNFIFLFAFDYSCDSVALQVDKMRKFKQRIDNCIPRGVHIKTRHTLNFDNNLVIGSDLLKLCFSKTSHQSPLFVSLPMFPNLSDNDFATALNRLLYRSGVYPVFNSFENITQTTSADFFEKLVKTNSCGFTFDINYLFNPSNSDLQNKIITNNVPVLPSISHDPSSYAGIAQTVQYYAEICGKTSYYKLCSQINNSYKKIGL
jgi:hypothetical protein